MSAIRRRVIVRGLVQGVYYRASCADVARSHGVSGYVRNRPDRRSVEIVVEGAPDAVAAVIDWAGRGPRHAIVESVEVTEEPPQGDVGFHVA